eukprot:719963-Hanusia_phi.AAC.1
MMMMMMMIRAREASAASANSSDRANGYGLPQCPHCQAVTVTVRFPGERPGICCEKGKIKLEPLPPVTDLLRTLLSRTTA